MKTKAQNCVNDIRENVEKMADIIDNKGYVHNNAYSVADFHELLKINNKIRDDLYEAMNREHNPSYYENYGGRGKSKEE